jgi:hypothetical protein
LTYKSIMAVWIFAYGRIGIKFDKQNQQRGYLDILNKIELKETEILDSIKESTQYNSSIRQHYSDYREQIESDFNSKTNKEYLNYLQSVNMPYVKIEDIVDRFIEDGEKMELDRLLSFNYAYEQFKSGDAKSMWEISGENYFTNKLHFFDPYQGFRLTIKNDLIWISGPWAVFSVYSNFQTTISKKSRDYYHSFFKHIFKAFQSDFILYAHELSGFDDEEDLEYNFEKLKEQSNWDKNSSDSIHTMDNFYLEVL